MAYLLFHSVESSVAFFIMRPWILTTNLGRIAKMCHDLLLIFLEDLYPFLQRYTQRKLYLIIEEENGFGFIFERKRPPLIV